MKKQIIILLITLTLLGAGCSNNNNRNSGFRPSDFDTSTDVITHDADGAVFTMTENEKSVDPQLVMDFGPEDSSEYSVVTSTDKYIILVKYIENDDGLSASYYKMDIKTRDIEPLYTPKNWSFLFDPVVVGNYMSFVMIEDSSEINDLQYDIIGVDLDTNESMIITSGTSYYYPVIAPSENVLSILTFEKDDSSTINHLSYYDFKNHKEKKIIDEPLHINADSSVTGYDFLSIFPSYKDIIIDVTKYDNEERLGVHKGKYIGKHALYGYSLSKGGFSALDFQPGFLCDYLMDTGEGYLVDREGARLDLNQSGYYYQRVGDRYERWTIPGISPSSNIKYASLIDDNLIFAILKTGAMIIDTENKTYWFKESFCITYSDGYIYYSEDNKIYSIAIKDIS
ncbi:hypothetical protein [Butyrivibrio sp. MC2013]|uniref:hypothetical protein n=1 Tax=Butyrivibrio sp. MC2013 TaxID=1280686 RepID=UPI0004267FB6|nr:hypothetical protein [Butyrivibrio sp. MC2013]